MHKSTTPKEQDVFTLKKVKKHLWSFCTLFLSSASLLFWRGGVPRGWERRIRGGQSVEDRNRPVQKRHRYCPFSQSWTCLCRRWVSTRWNTRSYFLRFLKSCFLSFFPQLVSTMWASVVTWTLPLVSACRPSGSPSWMTWGSQSWRGLRHLSLSFVCRWTAFWENLQRLQSSSMTQCLTVRHLTFYFHF